jgi:hypothetical protein
LCFQVRSTGRRPAAAIFLFAFYTSIKLVGGNAKCAQRSSNGAAKDVPMLLRELDTGRADGKVNTRTKCAEVWECGESGWIAIRSTRILPLRPMQYHRGSPKRPETGHPMQPVRPQRPIPGLYFFHAGTGLATPLVIGCEIRRSTGGNTPGAGLGAPWASDVTHLVRE